MSTQYYIIFNFYAFMTNFIVNLRGSLILVNECYWNFFMKITMEFPNNKDFSYKFYTYKTNKVIKFLM